VSACTRHTLAERPDAREEFRRLNVASWPEFLTEGDECGLDAVWNTIYTTFGAFQFLLRDEQGVAVAAGQTVPFAWTGETTDLPESIASLLRRAGEDVAAGRPANTLCAVAALVDPTQRARGLSTEILKHMRAIGVAHGLRHLVAPVRPTLKASYPLTPMERFITWRRPDGTLLDPWLRVHERLGAVVLGIAPRTMINVGTVAQWETWTGMPFPDSGAYVVPGALQPVRIDRDKDEGRYEDPNVWMRHPPLDGETAR
jgi:hypothetical protein